MEKEFIQNFKEAMDIKDRELSLSDEFRNYEEWDSLAFLEVIAMIDEQYDVVIEGNDFKKLKTLGEVYEEIKLKKEA